MYYLDQGLKEIGFGGFGKVLGVLYAIFIIGGAFGGGNMFQANQSYELVGSLTGIPSWMYGIILMVIVSAVIMGGIERIGKTTEKIVPTMVILYVLSSLFIIGTNIDKLPGVIQSIFSQAFYPDAIYGGILGVIVIGIKRAVFSNEGGVGSAAIAHSAAKTDEPVREGIVAMIGPFIDTIVICFMTASVILITADQNPLIHEEGIQGAQLTSAAFGSVLWWFPYILSIVVFLFSYSTMISWYYYGEKGWRYLSSGTSSLIIYKIVFLGCIFVGSISSLSNVIDFSDMMILSCAVPNIIGAFFLLPKLKTHLDDYWSRYQNNKFTIYK
jgi:AGCS family alanine or glycine:cation symporter